MASINIGEADFDILAAAAREAKRRGDMTAAIELDKLARKANAALTTANNRWMRTWTSGQTPTLRWTDVPSTLTP